MAGFRNKRLHLSGPEYITAALFVVVLLVGAFFFRSYKDVKSLYNLEKTSVDFIVSAPSSEQVDELESLSHVDSVVPYVFRSVDVASNKKNIETNLVIIDNGDLLSSTVFSDDLLIDGIRQQSDNPLYISDDFATTAKLSVGDEVEISLNGTVVHFEVEGIYGSDHRNVGGTIITILSEDVLDALGDSIRYSGAYICSNDINETMEYLDDYQPLGDLRSRDEYDSDEAYQIYLDGRNTRDSNAVFDKESFLRDIGKRNDAKLIRNLLISIACVIVSAVAIAISVSVRLSGYINKSVGKDIRNNFTLLQEHQMFRRFCVLDYLLLMIAYLMVLLIMFVILKINTITALSLIGIVLLLIIVVSVFISSCRKLDVEFSKQVKIIEEEKKAEQLISSNLKENNE